MFCKDTKTALLCKTFSSVFYLSPPKEPTSKCNITDVLRTLHRSVTTNSVTHTGASFHIPTVAPPYHRNPGRIKFDGEPYITRIYRMLGPPDVGHEYKLVPYL